MVKPWRRAWWAFIILLTWALLRGEASLLMVEDFSLKRCVART